MSVYDPNPWGNPSGGATKGAGSAGNSGVSAGKGLWSHAQKVPGLLGDMLNPYNDFNADYLRPDRDISNTLKTWALTGQGPSAAQEMVAQERNKNIAAAQSMAKSTPGVSHAGQQRLAQMGASRSIAEASSKGAVLRAQEQQQAMQNNLDQYRTMAQAYADAMRANAQVAAENASTKRGIIGGFVKGATGILGL